jgi:hypothetical protein
MTHSESERLELCIEKWKQFDEHVKESVPVRERLKTVELKVELLEKAVLRNAIMGGIIGALIGSGASPAIMKIVEVFLKVS